MALLTLTQYASYTDLKRLFSANAVNDRIDDLAEIQNATISGSPSGGTFTLAYNGINGASIAYNAAASDVQAALQLIPALGQVGVISAGAAPNVTFQISFISISGSASLLTVTNNLTGGASPAVTVSEVQAGSTLALDDALNYASEEINTYCYQRYDPIYLVQSNLVNRWCAYLACHHLSQRRGNPSLFDKEIDNIMDKMERVLNDRFNLPGVPERRNRAPTWDNLKMDARYRYHVQRVEPSTSSSQSSTQPQYVDWSDQFTMEQ